MESAIEKERFEGSYGQWLKQQLTSIPTVPWTMFGFGVGAETVVFLTGTINWLTFLSFVGVFFGMGCVCSMSSGHTINGLLGAISVVAYVIVNLQAHHWFSIIDQLCFFFLIDLELLMTWRTWGRGKNYNIKSLSIKQWTVTVVVILAAWFGLYHLGLITADNNPVWDSLALAIGGTASFLCFRRYTQTYTLWLISDFVNVALWFYALKDGYSPASLTMLVMELFYTATAIYGRFFSIWTGKLNRAIN
ncbi:MULTISPECIES: nicotinamide riboside transporter PnuC [unclassified Sporolactobacillus]|uniref:nicotinamide riboside transporter PnuC n=1 Tax=unclassified Sporolactobacillus TaxID=2628533 RepID=UPI002367A95D|nr:nicotinamide riboside transporter PnuC [Sporolactobacillus sp. CQH2019]MDD9148455.1 nicotinamide riboside transporter PnuC [Sporolactobacillus sp. CQH2019]